MREIKFRAWDKDEKEMVYGITFKQSWSKYEGDILKDYSDTKVIGNIYENPKLIKELQ